MVLCHEQFWILAANLWLIICCQKQTTNNKREIWRQNSKFFMAQIPLSRKLENPIFKQRPNSSESSILYKIVIDSSRCSLLSSLLYLYNIWMWLRILHISQTYDGYNSIHYCSLMWDRDLAFTMSRILINWDRAENFIDSCQYCQPVVKSVSNRI